ncbi:4Fe-4S binding protein [bacterium]|nr:4Fe-4S binding protein [bacterium]
MSSYKLYWNRDLCIDCGGCVSVCPTQALTLFVKELIYDVDRCDYCGFCERACPYGAITLTNEQ